MKNNTMLKFPIIIYPITFKKEITETTFKTHLFVKILDKVELSFIYISYLKKIEKY